MGSVFKLFNKLLDGVVVGTWLVLEWKHATDRFINVRLGIGI